MRAGTEKELAGGCVPRWAVMARAMELRKDGVEMKPLNAVKVEGLGSASEYRNVARAPKMTRSADAFTRTA